jgi:hypothetical protein
MYINIVIIIPYSWPSIYYLFVAESQVAVDHDAGATFYLGGWINHGTILDETISGGHS